MKMNIVKLIREWASKDEKVKDRYKVIHLGSIGRSQDRKNKAIARFKGETAHGLAKAPRKHARTRRKKRRKASRKMRRLNQYRMR